MAHLYFVQVFNTGEDLMEEAAGLSILESSLLHDVVEELTAGCVLHDQEQLLAGLNDLV